MKKFFTLFLCLLILGIGLQAQNLVAWYKFNGNANDYSGNNLNGTLVGPKSPTSTTDCSGTPNEAYSFPGYPGSFVANGIDVPHSALLNPGSYLVIDITFTTNQISGLNPYDNSYCNAFDLVNKGTDQDNGWYGLGISSTTNPSSGCGDPTGYGKLQFTIRFSDGTYGSVASTNVLSTGVCYHAVAVYNGSNLSLTLNGVLQQTITINKTLGLTTKKLTIGYQDNTPIAGYWFNGKIDDLKIYNNPNVPGSGNAIQLTETGSLATSPYINVGSGFDFGTQPFTYETWVKRDVIATTQNNYGKALFVGDNNGAWGIGIANDNTLFFTKIGINEVSSTGTIADTNWHHVSVVYTGSQIQFYIDGVAAGNPSYTDNFSNSSGNYFIGPRQSFGNSNGDQTLDGRIDETRIWKNVALTQTQIKDWMCKKVTSAHPAYNNLFAYYRFDEGRGTTTADLVGTHTGTLVNNPTWLTSGASLGDASAYDYTNTTKTVNLAAPTGESFTATSTSGNPSGIQIYRVDTLPNTLNGTQGVGGNKKYFGVFQINGISPQYTAVYHYNGNPGVSSGNENTLHLYKRPGNSDPLWADAAAALNTSAKTLTVTGQSTEYILGSTGFALPVSLLNLKAQLVSDHQVNISWQTASEQNNKGFDVLRSNDGTRFDSIGFVNGAGNSSSLLNYSFTDNSSFSGRIYYRLRQVDIDGNNKYSDIVSVVIDNNRTITVAPNPVTDAVIITGITSAQVRLFTLQGVEVRRWGKVAAGTRLNMSDVQPGMYLIQISTPDKTVDYKIVKE